MRPLWGALLLVLVVCDSVGDATLEVTRAEEPWACPGTASDWQRQEKTIECGAGKPVKPASDEKCYQVASYLECTCRRPPAKADPAACKKCKGSGAVGCERH